VRPGRRRRAVEAHVGGHTLFVSSAALPGGTTVIVARSPLSTYRALAVLSNLLTGVTAGAMLLTARGRVALAYRGCYGR